MTAPGRRERGAATLLVIAMAGVLLLVGAALGVVEAMVVAHRQAQAAADLAALAGAGAAERGEDGCLASRAVAGANGAELTSCAVAGGVVSVAVRVQGPRWLGQHGDLTAAARAGPAGVPQMFLPSSMSRRLSSSTLSSFSESSWSCLLSRRCWKDRLMPNLAML